MTVYTCQVHYTILFFDIRVTKSSQADEHEEDEEEYLVDHSIVFYLCGPDGEFIDFCTQGSQVLDMVSKIENLVRDYKNKLAIEARAKK